MRILLTSNASYAPPKGGSTRSNLIWLEHLARSGHVCRVLCPGDTSVVQLEGPIEVHRVENLSHRHHLLREHIAAFHPDWVLVSSEDLSHVLLREADAAAPGRLVYLAHTPQFYPFGPASWNADPAAAAIVRNARAVVAIAETTAQYIQQYCGASADVIHPPIYGNGPWRDCGNWASGYMLMINPCVVKGIGIFLELARMFPEVEFAGLAGWGTTRRDRAAMQALPNVRVLESVPDIDEVLCHARLLLMPSIWFEGFGLIAMEAMLRGLPVISSDAGGLVEAKRGTGYVIPVRPIEQFERAFDETHMPKPVEVPQDIAPWSDALQRLLADRGEYERESRTSRAVAIEFVSRLRAADFEDLLERITPGVGAPSAAAAAKPGIDTLSPAKRALLLQRLRSREKR